MREWFWRVIYRYWQRFHGVRRLELATLRRYLSLEPGQRILDVGSGKGAFCGELAREGLHAVGLDPAFGSVGIAKRWVDSNGRFLVGSGEMLPFPSASFDQAVSVCVLEHTSNDEGVLSEVCRVLKPGGLFALTVDCLNSPYLSESFRRRHRREYRCHQLYDDSKIRALLRKTGFQTLETRYLFTGRSAIAILRFGSRFHYRGPFVLLFPLLYPVLWLDCIRRLEKTNGMILAVRAKKTSNGVDVRFGRAVKKSQDLRS